MNDTGYKIDTAKFFGVQPDENLSMKRDALEFYGTGKPASPARSISKYNGHYDSQENVHTNVMKNQNRRSTVGHAGNTILRSSSVRRLHPSDDNNPIIHNTSPDRGNTHNSPYKNRYLSFDSNQYRMQYFSNYNSMPRLATIKDIEKKERGDTQSIVSEVSEIVKQKKKIFGLNENTLNILETFKYNKNDPPSAMTRSLTHAPSTNVDKKAGETPSPFIGRESDNYKDISKEKLNQAVNQR